MRMCNMEFLGKKVVHQKVILFVGRAVKVLQMTRTFQSWKWRKCWTKRNCECGGKTFAFFLRKYVYFRTHVLYAMCKTQFAILSLKNFKLWRKVRVLLTQWDSKKVSTMNKMVFCNFEHWTIFKELWKHSGKKQLFSPKLFENWSRCASLVVPTTIFCKREEGLFSKKEKVVEGWLCRVEVVIRE